MPTASKLLAVVWKNALLSLDSIGMHPSDKCTVLAFSMSLIGCNEWVINKSDSEWNTVDKMPENRVPSFFNFLWFEKAYFKNDRNQKNANGQGRIV